MICVKINLFYHKLNELQTLNMVNLIFFSNAKELQFHKVKVYPNLTSILLFEILKYAYFFLVSGFKLQPSTFY